MFVTLKLFWWLMVAQHRNVTLYVVFSLHLSPGCRCSWTCQSQKARERLWLETLLGMWLKRALKSRALGNHIGGGSLENIRGVKGNQGTVEVNSAEISGTASPAGTWHAVAVLAGDAEVAIPGESMKVGIAGKSIAEEAGVATGKEAGADGLTHLLFY